MDIEDKIRYCEKLYDSIGRPTIYKLTPVCYPEDLDQRLESKGYVKVDETALRILHIPESYGEVEASGLEIEYEFTPEWINSFSACANITNASTVEVMTRMLNNIADDKIVVKLQNDNKTIACGFGVIEAGYVGIFDIIVDKEHRGNGYGKAIMKGILKETLKKDIHKAYLQVVVGNTIAENLYTSLGFQEVYRYWYRVKRNQ
jgi:RimJ/RimL family protein N-acetyltransferase